MLDDPLPALLTDKRRQVWVCGPGLGQDEARTVLPVLLAAGREVVVDADALTAFAGHPEAFAGAAVLTPHAGEFLRVFGPPGPGPPGRRPRRGPAMRRRGGAEGQRHGDCRARRPCRH